MGHAAMARQSRCDKTKRSCEAFSGIGTGFADRLKPTEWGNGKQ